MLLRDNASDTQSLASFSSQYQNQWGTEFLNIIYKLCGTQNPGIPIDLEAVQQIRDTVVHILNALLELKAPTVEELDRWAGERIIPKSCEEMRKDAWNQMEKSAHIIKKTRLFMNKPHELHVKMLHLVKESHPNRGREKRDREKEKELDRIAIYLNSICEIIAEDILKWTGNYVRNIRTESELRINVQNLKIAMSSDRALIDLTSSIACDEDDTNNGFLTHVLSLYDVKIEPEEGETQKMTYESIAKEFLKDERLFLRNLKQINVYRKKLYELVENKALLKMLFGNFNDIYEITIKMERLLEDYIETSDTPTIGFAVWDLAEACEFESYHTYVMRELEDEPDEQPFHVGIHRALNELLDVAKYPHLFDKGTEYVDNKSFKMTLQYVLPDLLKLPILHFFHYIEYISKLEQYGVGEDKYEISETKRNLTLVGNRLEKLLGHHMDLKTLILQDQAVRSESQITKVQRLHETENNIDNFVGNPIAKTCLELVKDGELTMVRPSYTGSLEQPLKGKWATARQCYLFDQMLLMCKKHKPTKYKFKDRFPTQLISTINMEDHGAMQNTFRIEISSKPGEEKIFFTFCCKTKEEKEAWMTAFIKTTTKSFIERQINYNDKEEAKKYPLVMPAADQYRFAEPDSDDNITFEDYTSSSGVPVVKSATIVKLVERLTYHQYTDNKFVQTFLISFRAFCTPQELLKLLEERFNVPEPKILQEKSMRGGPLMGRYDTVQSHGLSSPPFIINDQALMRFRKEYERPIQRNVLSVLMQWVKNHYYDFSTDPELLIGLKEFLDKNISTQGKLILQHRKYCKNILTTIDKQKYKNLTERQPTNFDFSELATARLEENRFQPQPPEILWHTAKKGDITNYDLLTLHPLEVGRQLTLLHFDLYKAVKPIELVNAQWTKHDKRVKSPQLLRLTDHTNMLVYWVSRSIVETESLEERVALLSRVIEVMSVFEELHNFTGLVAFSSALKSASVGRLALSKEKLSREKNKRYEQLEKLCGDGHWQGLRNRLKNINPPCVPFFGMYMTEIFYTTENNSTFVKSNPLKENPDSCPSPSSQSSSKQKKLLVSFFKCRRVSEIIREIQMYQNQAYSFQTEPTIRQFFESINPKTDFKSNDELEEYLFKCSKKIEPKEPAERPPDVPPRHPPHVLKSPGIKPPKSNSTTSSSGRSYSTQTSTAPSTPSYDSVDTPRLNSSSDEMAIASQRLPSAEHDKKLSPFGLIPPPLPRKTIKSGTPPSTSSPLLRRPTNSAMSPPALKTPSPTPNSAKRFQDTQTFVFPSVNHESPVLPPKRSPPPSLPSPSSSADSPTTNQLVVLKNGSPAEPSSPSVRMVLPLHPPKLPPRIKKDSTKPPELPPKTYKRLVSTGSSTGAPSAPSSSLPSPTLSPPAIGVNLGFSSSSESCNFSNTAKSSPPPLPPKTYKKLP